MKISIVIATFNAARYLRECLDSCIAQTWHDKEIIIVDGGSTDGTVDIIRRYEQHIAYWHSKPDKGVYDAWNQALDHITGEWVLFRGADDTFASDEAMECIVPYLHKAQLNEVVVYGQVDFVSENGEYQRTRGEAWPEARAMLQRRMSIPHPAAFHRVDAFRKYGRFDAAFRIVGDYEWLLRILQHAEARFAPGIVVSRMRAGGLTGRGDLRVYLEVIRARRKNGMRGAPWAQYLDIASLWKSNAIWGAIALVAGDARASKWRTHFTRFRHSGRTGHGHV